MVLQEAEPMEGLRQTSQCPFPAPQEQEQLSGASPAQSPKAIWARPMGDADSLSSSPGGATSDSTEEDESSSTESTRHRDESIQAGEGGCRLRGEQEESLSRIAELESHIKELQHQQKEMNIEMRLEEALLEGELVAEQRELQRDEQLVLQLQRRIAETLQRCHTEKDKQEKARLRKERHKVEELQRQHVESQAHLESQPESMRERLQSQLQQTSEMLEGALKSYEDLEFQQLERESRLEEEKEAACKALACKMAQVRDRLQERKRKVLRLEGQVHSVQQHMAGERLRLAQEKGKAIQNLSSERRRMQDLGKVCGDDDSPISNQELTKAMQMKLRYLDLSYCHLQLMFTQKTDQKVVLLGHDQHDPTCVFSVRSSVQGSIGLRRSRSLPRRRVDRSSERPRSLNTSAGLDPGVLPPQLSAGDNRRCLPLSCLSSTLYSLGGPTTGLYRLAEMERMVREAMAERERLLQAREAKQTVQGETQNMKLPPPAQDRSLGPAQEPPVATPLDLRAHLEASGHSLETCPEVRVTGRACRGFLVKMGGRIKTWKKRWFCFDRQRRLLSYYVDKEETKLKGVIYFQAIEEVYYDHLRCAIKSPSPKLTFCVKTYDRLFCLVAPSAEAMRIWMDAIVTAAEENARY